jgi:hypothetical protein
VPCLVLLLAFISPRLGLIVMWLFTNVLGRAFDSWILPVAGFFLLPWTTLVYALAWESGRNAVTGIEWFFVGLAFLVDVGSYAGGARGRG